MTNPFDVWGGNHVTRWTYSLRGWLINQYHKRRHNEKVIALPPLAASPVSLYRREIVRTRENAKVMKKKMKTEGGNQELKRRMDDEKKNKRWVPARFLSRKKSQSDVCIDKDPSVKVPIFFQIAVKFLNRIGGVSEVSWQWTEMSINYRSRDWSVIKLLSEKETWLNLMNNNWIIAKLSVAMPHILAKRLQNYRDMTHREVNILSMQRLKRRKTTMTVWHKSEFVHRWAEWGLNRCFIIRKHRESTETQV